MFETPGFTGSHTTRILAKTGAGRLVHDTDFCSRMRFRADESERTKQIRRSFKNFGAKPQKGGSEMVYFVVRGVVYFSREAALAALRGE